MRFSKINKFIRLKSRFFFKVLKAKRYHDKSASPKFPTVQLSFGIEKKRTDKMSLSCIFYSYHTAILFFKLHFLVKKLMLRI